MNPLYTVSTVPLYLQLAQIIAGRPLGPMCSPQPEEYCRDLQIHCARNSGNEISHITMEFAGDFRAQFLVCILFDGSGDKGTGLNYIAMPKVKLPKELKALVALSCLTFLCESGLLNAPVEYFREKVAADLFQEAAAQRRGATNQGRAVVGDVLKEFDALTQIAQEYVAAQTV